MPTEHKGADAQVIMFSNATAFETWLEEHCDVHGGVWLRIAKQGSGVESLTSDEAVDVGLCFGWISGLRKSDNDVYYLQKYVPRRPRSRWSQINVAKLERLTAAGRMRPSGTAEVEAAKADGRWAVAYESQRNASISPDLAAALEANPVAANAFHRLSKTQQYGIILKLTTARSHGARAKQLDRALAVLLKSSTSTALSPPLTTFVDRVWLDTESAGDH